MRSGIWKSRDGRSMRSGATFAKLTCLSRLRNANARLCIFSMRCWPLFEPDPSSGAGRANTERVQLLEAELGGRMPALPGAIDARRAKLRIAVNDDSMSTWFIDVASEFCIERGLLLDLVVDDQDHTAARVRDGDVQGAVTTQAEPVQGWRSVRLGRMRYRAVCSPAYHARHFSKGLTRDSLRQAPLRSLQREGRFATAVPQASNWYGSLLAELASGDRMAGRVQRDVESAREGESKIARGTLKCHAPWHYCPAQCRLGSVNGRNKPASCRRCSSVATCACRTPMRPRACRRRPDRSALHRFGPARGVRRPARRRDRWSDR